MTAIFLSLYFRIGWYVTFSPEIGLLSSPPHADWLAMFYAVLQPFDKKVPHPGR
jgi:hypothetical protein